MRSRRACEFRSAPSDSGPARPNRRHATRADVSAKNSTSSIGRNALSSRKFSYQIMRMEEHPFDSERPPDEAWWERELHRNEKLMDKYMAVLGDNPDWDKWQNPEDIYNKVHFDIDPHGRDANAPVVEEVEDEPMPEWLAEANE